MLTIDKEKCTACGVCEATCAFGAIAVKGDCAEVNESCTLCGACVDNCPEAALRIEIVVVLEVVGFGAYTSLDDEWE